MAAAIVSERRRCGSGTSLFVSPYPTPLTLCLLTCNLRVAAADMPILTMAKTRPSQLFPAQDQETAPQGPRSHAPALPKAGQQGGNETGANGRDCDRPWHWANMAMACKVALRVGRCHGTVQLTLPIPQNQLAAPSQRSGLTIDSSCRLSSTPPLCSHHW